MGPMPGKKHTPIDRLIGRLDTLDPVNIANLVQRLAKQRTLYEQIFKTLQEGVLVISADGIIEYANEAAHRLIGLNSDELDGQILWRLIPGLRPTMGDAAGAGTQDTHVIAREFELTYPEPRTVRLYMVPFPGDDRGSEPRHAVILADVTHDRMTTEQRIEDERTSSILLLAAGVAHELGNPLNSLTIHLQLIARKLKKLGTSPEARSIGESVDVCTQEVARLDGIITHYLEALRPTPPDLAEASLPDVLAEVLKFQKSEFEDRGIAVEAETPAALPHVMADRNQLKQVFFNITKNAMESMQPGGRLMIKSRADDDSVYLLFADSGSGIRQEDLVRLFQPYHTTKPGGHGLGLMIVQRIMRMHGGQVGVESREGKGTVVTLQFPRKDRRVRMLGGG
jgi:two-component system, sporulation sensor kinase E